MDLSREEREGGEEDKTLREFHELTRIELAKFVKFVSEIFLKKNLSGSKVEAT